LIGKLWSNLASTALSVYILTKAAYMINYLGWSQWLEFLVKQWKFAQEYKTSILEIFEVQLILALIVFGLSAFYLSQEASHRRISKSRFI
jgi:hypothetical protein